MAKQKTTTKLKREAKKQAKKNPILVILLVLFLGGGAIGGYFGGKYITRNDTFEVVGEKTVYLSVGESFEDEGAKAVSFGRDVSDKIVAEVDENLDTSVAGEYYVKYTVDDIRFKSVVRYRYIIVQEVGNEE